MCVSQESRHRYPSPRGVRPVPPPAQGQRQAVASHLWTARARPAPRCRHSAPRAAIGHGRGPQGRPVAHPSRGAGALGHRATGHARRSRCDRIRSWASTLRASAHARKRRKGMRQGRAVTVRWPSARGAVAARGERSRVRWPSALHTPMTAGTVGRWTRTRSSQEVARGCTHRDTRQPLVTPTAPLPDRAVYPQVQVSTLCHATSTLARALSHQSARLVNDCTMSPDSASVK